MPKLYVVNLELADCTCDAHNLTVDNIPKALEVVLDICKSDIVQCIRSIGYTDERPGPTGMEEHDFRSDVFVLEDYEGLRKSPPEHYIKKHKIAPFLFHDADVDDLHHLRPGLSGIKDLVELIPQRLAHGYVCTAFYIGVVWAFAGDHSCSDYIYIVGDDYGASSTWEMEGFYKPVVIAPCSQDWWETKPGHKDMVEGIEQLTGFTMDGNCWACTGEDPPVTYDE